MSRLRWLTITLALPLVYLAVLYQATRPPKPIYTFAQHTVMTVTGKGGPAILHAPRWSIRRKRCAIAWKAA